MNLPTKLALGRLWEDFRPREGIGMNVIVETLRALHAHPTCSQPIQKKAADDIEQLRAEVERLKAEIEREKEQTEIVLDSYVDENQRFHDTIERLRPALKCARGQLVTLGGEAKLATDDDQIQAQVLYVIDAALADQGKALEQFYDANPSDAPFGSD